MDSKVRPLLLATLTVSGFVLGTSLNGDSILTRTEMPKANLAIATPPAEIVEMKEPSQAREFKRADDGLFYITANIGNVPVRFIVDTGATVVVLTQKDANRIGLDPGDFGQTDNIQTASGPGLMHWAKIDSLELAGHQLSSIDVAVSSSDLKSSLLGQNALSRLGSVSLSGDRLIIK